MNVYFQPAYFLLNSSSGDSVYFIIGLFVACYLIIGGKSSDDDSSSEIAYVIFGF